MDGPVAEGGRVHDERRHEMSIPTRRLDRDTADLLLDGDPNALNRAGRLAALLRALCGPARPHELEGEPAAVAAFLARLTRRRPP
ncbi:hypothetical protein [Micromonospora sp. NPDC047134]|uniref:hypothetical protein n=1 Tax=Micromonospora sp. NPDC047134 TaxID=3154340 RepID=UPI0033E8524D